MNTQSLTPARCIAELRELAKRWEAEGYRRLDGVDLRTDPVERRIMDFGACEALRLAGELSALAKSWDALADLGLQELAQNPKSE
ncbi:hypothetical protein [Niveibacterium sp. SC-1]|uniref:hypothetical protein n=1 Tax=Niveibacterium sp. SC-1 TaxID=3135646 RepID=UPI00311D4060